MTNAKLYVIIFNLPTPQSPNKIKEAHKRQKQQREIIKLTTTAKDKINKNKKNQKKTTISQYDLLV